MRAWGGSRYVTGALESIKAQQAALECPGPGDEQLAALQFHGAVGALVGRYGQDSSWGQLADETVGRRLRTSGTAHGCCSGEKTISSVRLTHKPIIIFDKTPF